MIVESKSGSDDSEPEIQNPFDTVDADGKLYEEDENSITVGEVLLINNVRLGCCPQSHKSMYRGRVECTACCCTPRN